MKVWILEKKEHFKKYENKRFIEEAEKEGIDLKMVAPEDFEIIVTKEGEKSILYRSKPVGLPDCLVPRMGAGTTYFALAVMRHLEQLGIFVLNSSQSIEVAKDKLASMQILARHNIPIPKTILAKFPLDIKLIKREFQFPIIIKTVSGARGKGVFLCETEDQLKDLVGFLEQSKDPAANVILQEFVSSSRGKDMRVFIVGGRPVGAILRIAKEGTFKANYSYGGTVEPIELKRAAEWLAVESANLTGLEVAGVDLLFDGDHYKICEVNSAPDFKGFESATKINIPKYFFDYLKVRCEIPPE